MTRNGNLATSYHSPTKSDSDNQLSKLTTSVAQIRDNQVALTRSLRTLLLVQIAQFAVLLLLGEFVLNDGNLKMQHCRLSQVCCTCGRVTRLTVTVTVAIRKGRCRSLNQSWPSLRKRSACFWPLFIAFFMLLCTRCADSLRSMYN